jgi:GntR family transcriptional regulator/MocR family aminotransferase
LRHSRDDHYILAMARAISELPPMISVDRRGSKPLHKQVYEAFRAAILARQLRGGQKVPSSRSLAIELNVSRLPVLSAYAQLLAEGYFEARSGSGTFVSSSLPEEWTSVEQQHTASPVAMRPGRRSLSRRSAVLPPFTGRPWQDKWGAFVVGQVAFEHFPGVVWSRLVNRHVRDARVNSFHYGDPMGSYALRSTIAEYLRTARAVNCDADQIMIVAGSQQALELSARVLLDPGDKVWMEDPGYTAGRSVFALAGCRLVPVPVDAEGLDVSAGIELARRACAVFVTPSHQFPLGVTMSVARRLQLLDWAQRSGAWIIEDDYDSEYRYESMPIASLQGLDRNSRVIYIGTFSKTLFPSLRLGYLVIPRDLLGRFLTIRHSMDLGAPTLYQSVLTDFISQGYFARHIRKMRLIYSERRNALADAIRAAFDSSVEVIGAQAGMHLVMTLPPRAQDSTVCNVGAQRELWLWPLSRCYFGRASRQGLVLGFGSTTPRQIANAGRRLREVIEA